MERLLDMNHEAFVPFAKQVKQWSDRKKVIESPLFTGYVFVKLTEHEFDKPLYVPGVLNYLRFSNQYAIVKDEEIESLKFFIEKGYNLELDSTELIAGQKVKVMLSQFKDMLASVNEVHDKNYVTVVFEGIQKNIRLKAPASALKIIQ